MRRLVFLAPIAVFLGLVTYFAIGLTRDPARLPSTLIGRALPAFDLAPMPGRTERLRSAELTGKPRLLNVFGSWCVACAAEHPLLVEIAQSGKAEIVGVDWMDKPGAGARWLARRGDPYARIGDDPQSRTVIDLGVTGAPETFVIDARGIVRHKVPGQITPAIWATEIAPLLERLNHEAAASTH